MFFLLQLFAEDEILSAFAINRDYLCNMLKR